MKRSELKRARFAKSEPKPAKGTHMVACKNRACRKRFVPPTPFIRHCSDACFVVLAEAHVAKLRATREKAERAETKRRKEDGKKRTDWISEAQTAFNAFIRERDRDQPCICCGKYDGGNHLTGGGWDAGHWISRGHASHLRFDERNVHKQRKGCNRPGGTTRARYRVGLVARIGEDAVRALEAIEYAPAEKLWSIEECKAIKTTYAAKLRELKGKA